MGCESGIVGCIAVKMRRGTNIAVFAILNEHSDHLQAEISQLYNIGSVIDAEWFNTNFCLSKRLSASLIH